MTATPAPQNVADYEALARQRLDTAAFDYYAGGSGDECTLAENVRAFDRVWLKPRVLVDVSHVEVATTLLVRRVSIAATATCAWTNHTCRPSQGQTCQQPS